MKLSMFLFILFLKVEVSDSDSQDYIYFNELLFCVLKRCYHPQIDAGKNDLAKKEIRHFESSTRLKLKIKKKARVIFY